MQSELRRTRRLLVAGAVLSVVRVDAWWSTVTADVLQVGALVALFLAGLWIRHATAEASVDTQTGVAVALLAVSPLLHVAAIDGHGLGVLTAPVWAAGVLLSMWAAARALDDAGEVDAPLWSLAYVTGLLVWTPVAILYGRVLWATHVTGVDGVDVGVEGAEAFLVATLMVTPFLLLFGTSSPTPHREEVRA